MRITLIHNPGAGRQAARHEQALERLLGGHDVRYQSSKEKGWRKALEAPAELVLVAGGDGTVARVARAMAGRGVPMAVLPCGTANNIARSLGLVGRPFEELTRGLERARRTRLDVGTVRGPWGERRFVEGVGAGLFAELLADPADGAEGGKATVEAALQRLKAIAAHCEPFEITAELDGRDISGRYLLLEVLNIAYVGPNLHLAFESRPGDGQLVAVRVTEAERGRLAYYLEHWQDNRERLAVLPTLRGKALKMEWTGFALHVDDKLLPKADAKPREMAGLVEARLQGESVEFLVPA